MKTGNKQSSLTFLQKLTYLGFILLFLTPVFLFFLPADYFDSGQSVCLSVRLANTECYACGMTRAIQHLLHFDFKTAWEYNKLSVIVAPLIVYTVLEAFVKFRKEIKKQE